MSSARSPRFAARWSSRKVGEEVEGAVDINPDNIESYLGVKRFRFGRKEEADRVGQVTGLAWTEVGRGSAHDRGGGDVRGRASPPTPAGSGM